MAHQHSSSCGCGKPVNSCGMPATSSAGKSSGSTKQFRTNYDGIDWGRKDKSKKAEVKK